MARFSSWSLLGVVGRALAWSRYACSPRGGVARGAYGRMASLLGSLVAVLVLAGVCAGPAAAKTAVTSNITANTTWTMAGSPYDLDKSVSVTAGVTLTIEPGVTVDFNAGEYASLSVSGTIKSLGTASSPVVFTSSQALLGGGAPGQYYDVSVASGNASSQFSYTDFSYGGKGSGGHYAYGELYIYKGSTVTVEHSTFEHNEYSAVLVAGGAANISYSTVASNGGGVAAIGENVVNISHSTVVKNLEDGLFWDAQEKPTKATEMSVMYNTVAENAMNGVYIEQSCTSALSLFPHGEYNNIYANDGAKEAKKQLGTLSTCKALAVDWENNYWGSEAYYYHNSALCRETSTPYPGHVAYSWSKPAHEYEVPEGPITSGSAFNEKTVEGKKLVFGCGWDTFNITNILQSPVANGAPEPTGPVLYGGGSLATPNLVKLYCGDPVNCLTGNFSETYTDLRVPGLNDGLTFTRSYNSQAAANGTHGTFGYGWSFEFGETLSLDPSGQSATVTNADGSTVTFTNLEGAWRAPAWVQATLVHNEDGTYTYTLPDQRAFTFSSAGVLQKITDRNGNATTLTYGSGRLETITDPAGRKLTLAYNAEGLVESVKDPMGHTVKYAYEGGNLKSVTEPGEASPRWQFKYDSSREITEVIDGRGGIVLNKYDGSHRVTEQKDALERKTTWSYASGETQVTLPTGSVTRALFSKDLPTSITHAYGTTSAATTSYGYDENDNLISVTDPNSHITKYGYDGQGNRTSVLDANEHETKWTYDSTHDVLSVTTPRGEKTTIERDSHGNATSISRPAPGSTTQTTKYEYDSHGNLTSAEDPLKRVTKYGYDSNGDRTSETDPEGEERTWEYDEDSHETATVSPRGNVEGGEPAKYKTTIERDAQERPVKVTDPLGHETKYAYDPSGNLETQTDPNGHTTSYTYDADNEQIKVKEANGTITETGYDGVGRVVSQTDGDKHETKYVRNLLGEVTEVIDPLGRKTVKEYDAAGNLKALTDPANRTATYTYDSANRLMEVSYSDGKTHAVKYEYDADGDRISMLDGTGTTSYTYDQLDRLTESKDGHGDKVSYEYDLANQQTKITYPGGKSVIRAYDKAGRLETVTDWLEHTTKFAYDPDSNLTTVTFPTGTGNADKYAYNNADQMSEATMTKGTETLASLIYARDNDGQVKTITSNGLPGEEKPTFEYDANNRLTKGAATAYEYDAANNTTKIGTGAYTYDKANELETGPSLKYTYDELGERTKTIPSTGPATSYAYDQAGDLTSVERPKEGEIAEIKDTYAYDGSGLRASQTISGTTSYLTWELAQSAPSILDDGTNSYIYGPGGLPVEQVSSGGTVTYLHHDQQGSTRMLTGSTGAVTGTTTFDAYGNETGSTGTSTTQLGYDGQYTSADTGLIYMRARVYDPATAQFLTTDPLAGITRTTYNYAGQNPLTYNDPSGLLLGIPGTPTNGEVLSAAGKFGEAVGGLAVEGGEYLGGLAVKAGEQIVGLAHYATPAVIAGLCLAAPEVCESAVTIGLVVDFGIEAYEIVHNPTNALEQSRHMSILDDVSGLDAQAAFMGPALAAAELQATAAALQGVGRPGGAVVLVC
jgi:RHS repeat-associated protein